MLIRGEFGHPVNFLVRARQLVPIHLKEHVCRGGTGPFVSVKEVLVCGEDVDVGRCDAWNQVVWLVSPIRGKVSRRGDSRLNSAFVSDALLPLVPVQLVLVDSEDVFFLKKDDVVHGGLRVEKEPGR